MALWEYWRALPYKLKDSEKTTHLKHGYELSRTSHIQGNVSNVRKMLRLITLHYLAPLRGRPSEGAYSAWSSTNDSFVMTLSSTRTSFKKKRSFSLAFFSRYTIDKSTEKLVNQSSLITERKIHLKGKIYADKYIGNRIRWLISWHNWKVPSLYV